MELGKDCICPHPYFIGKGRGQHSAPPRPTVIENSPHPAMSCRTRAVCPCAARTALAPLPWFCRKIAFAG